MTLEERPVTFEVNNTWSFLRRYYIYGPSDGLRRQFLRWNYAHFVESPTFWLRVGSTMLVDVDHISFRDFVDEDVEVEVEDEEADIAPPGP